MKVLGFILAILAIQLISVQGTTDNTNYCGDSSGHLSLLLGGETKCITNTCFETLQYLPQAQLTATTGVTTPTFDSTDLSYSVVFDVQFNDGSDKIDASCIETKVFVHANMTEVTQEVGSTSTSVTVKMTRAQYQECTVTNPAQSEKNVCSFSIQVGLASITVGASFYPIATKTVDVDFTMTSTNNWVLEKYADQVAIGQKTQVVGTPLAGNFDRKYFDVVTSIERFESNAFTTPLNSDNYKIGDVAHFRLHTTDAAKKASTYNLSTLVVKTIFEEAGTVYENTLTPFEDATQELVVDQQYLKVSVVMPVFGTYTVSLECEFNP